jgi:hypothetical protein
MKKSNKTKAPTAKQASHLREKCLKTFVCLQYAKRDIEQVFSCLCDVEKTFRLSAEVDPWRKKETLTWLKAISAQINDAIKEIEPL